MTRDKAIEILTLLTRHGGWLGNPDNVDAIKLGIEALKCIQKLRTYEYFGYPTELPGEDPE
ncbi:unnamed protein product [marine sediment metagenome]|uniref:Uncharacterized protein n=1 Tax=marine sediment metagenome TaxID=412755 RepID=X1KN14_9ZZZZ